MIEGYSLMYIALGAWMVAHGSATFGQVFAFYMYSRYVTMPMMRVVNFLDMFQQGIVGVRRYLEVLKEEPERDVEDSLAAKDAKSAKGIESCDLCDLCGKNGGEIVFSNVRCRYPGTDRDVLDIPSLVIPAGNVCAFVGPSGGGKSTIAVLSARLKARTSPIPSGLFPMALTRR